jgi:hypothetical protein
MRPSFRPVLLMFRPQVPSFNLRRTSDAWDPRLGLSAGFLSSFHPKKNLKSPVITGVRSLCFNLWCTLVRVSLIHFFSRILLKTSLLLTSSIVGLMIVRTHVIKLTFPFKGSCLEPEAIFKVVARGTTRTSQACQCASTVQRGVLHARHRRRFAQTDDRMIPRLMVFKVNGTRENSKIAEYMYMGRADLLKSCLYVMIDLEDTHEVE